MPATMTIFMAGQGVCCENIQYTNSNCLRAHASCECWYRHTFNCVLLSEGHMITLVFMSVLLSWLWALVHYSLIVEVVLQVLVGVPPPVPSPPWHRWIDCSRFPLSMNECENVCEVFWYGYVWIKLYELCNEYLFYQFHHRPAAF